MKILLLLINFILISTVFTCQIYNAGTTHAFCGGQCPNGYFCSTLGNVCYCGFRPGTIGKKNILSKLYQ